MLNEHFTYSSKSSIAHCQPTARIRDMHQNLTVGQPRLIFICNIKNPLLESSRFDPLLKALQHVDCKSMSPSTPRVQPSMTTQPDRREVRLDTEVFGANSRGMSLKVVNFSGYEALGFFGLFSGADSEGFEDLNARTDVVENPYRKGSWGPGCEVPDYVRHFRCLPFRENNSLRLGVVIQTRPTQVVWRLSARRDAG